MDTLDLSAALRKEADVVLAKVDVWKALREYGRVIPHGSYFLDTMVYPDIDMYVSQVSFVQFCEIAARFAVSELVVELICRRPNYEKLPGGYFMKVKIDYGDWGRPWNIDLWTLDDTLIDEQMQADLHFEQRMTPELRQQIISYKFSILNAEKRTPKFSGYHIYKAFLEEGLRDFEDVTRYLRAHGIEMGF